MNFIKGMMLTVACGAAFFTAGCMNSELKPDAMNGIYNNGDITLICYYETDLEMPNKDKYYEYTFQGNGGKSNKKDDFWGQENI